MFAKDAVTVPPILKAVVIPVGSTCGPAKIASTSFEGGGGGSASIPSPIEAPRISAPSQGSTQLNANGTIKQQPSNNQVSKVFVVETDITKAQKRVKLLETNSKL